MPVSEVLTYEAPWSWKLGVETSMWKLGIGTTNVCWNFLPCPNLVVFRSDLNSSDLVGNLKLRLGKVFY